MNWNGKKFLETCLPTLFSSDYKNLEIIVLDCASRDDSVRFVKENYPTVKVVEFERDPGPACAYSVGARQAKGDYILLLNNDTRVPPETIPRLVEALNHDVDSVVIPAEMDWQGNTVPSGAAYFWLTPLYMLTKPFLPLYKKEEAGPFYVGVVCALMPKIVLLDTPTNEHIFFHEDLEWCWRLHLCKVKLKVLEDTHILHKGSGTIKLTTKPAYFTGRAMIASHYVCLKPVTLLFFSPLLFVYYVVKSALYIFRGRPDCFLAFLKGFGNFLSNIRLFNQDRRVAQKKRRIGDIEIIKKMLLSCHYLYTDPTSKSTFTTFFKKIRTSI
jgi:GT2 family glycosyltransferase